MTDVEKFILARGVTKCEPGTANATPLRKLRADAQFKEARARYLAKQKNLESDYDRTRRIYATVDHYSDSMLDQVSSI